MKTLAEWSQYIASVHALPMELGLERVRTVATRLALLQPTASVITVAGTNGKGSTVAGLEAIYVEQQYKVGSFTSPYLLRLNEEVRLQGQEIDDARLGDAFAQIEVARGEIALTVFEFNTLAALIIFKAAACDVIILEVGLGGRLDAVNIIDADVAVITSIAIDHAELLGATRELIAREKAGVFRQGKPVVCGDSQPPSSLVDCAKALAAPFFCVQQHFYYYPGDDAWGWKSATTHYDHLPTPALALENMATVLMTIEVMQSRLPVRRAALVSALRTLTLAGRIQIVPGAVTRIFDVAHNPAAVKMLAAKVQCATTTGKTRAVFSMLNDKDMAGALQAIKHLIDAWYIAELPVTRGAPLKKIRDVFAHEKIAPVNEYSDVESAYAEALAVSENGDRVLVFGSFYTVAAIAALV